MGLRCLLGHDFAEPRTEREREERGDEVIVAIRRVKECRRCGETRVVSENKEVTSMHQPGGVDEPEPAATGGAPDGSTAPARSGDTGGRASADEATGAADTASAGRQQSADDGGRSLIEDAEAGFDHPEATLDGVDTSVEDDAEIINGGPSDADTPSDAGGRGHGQWPDADVNDTSRSVDRGGGADDAHAPTAVDATADADETPADPADEDAAFIDADEEANAAATGTDERVPWPDHDGEAGGVDGRVGADATAVDESDNGTDTDDGSAASDAGEYIEAESNPLDDGPSIDPTGGTGVSSEDGSWGATGSADADAEHETTGGGSSEASAVSGVGLRTTSDDPDAEYVCPECGAREPVGASSTRAGDICPDCKRGYIEERELE